MKGVNETLCTRCSHKNVCKNMSDYLAILSLVRTLMLWKGEIECPVNEIEWAQVRVSCSNWGNNN